MADRLLFLLIFVAPLMQIVLSVLRLMHKIKLSVIIIAFISLFTGLILSFLAGTIFVANTPPCKNCTEGPAVVGIYMAIGGMIITIISTPVIAIIAAIIYWYQNKQSAKVAGM